MNQRITNLDADIMHNLSELREEYHQHHLTPQEIQQQHYKQLAQRFCSEVLHNDPQCIAVFQTLQQQQSFLDLFTEATKNPQLFQYNQVVSTQYYATIQWIHQQAQYLRGNNPSQQGIYNSNAGQNNTKHSQYLALSDKEKKFYEKVFLKLTGARSILEAGTIAPKIMIDFMKQTNLQPQVLKQVWMQVMPNAQSPVEFQQMSVMFRIVASIQQQQQLKATQLSASEAYSTSNYLFLPQIQGFIETGEEQEEFGDFITSHNSHGLITSSTTTATFSNTGSLPQFQQQQYQQPVVQQNHQHQLHPAKSLNINNNSTTTSNIQPQQQLQQQQQPQMQNSLQQSSAAGNIVKSKYDVFSGLTAGGFIETSLQSTPVKPSNNTVTTNNDHHHQGEDDFGEFSEAHDHPQQQNIQPQQSLFQQQQVNHHQDEQLDFGDFTQAGSQYPPKQNNLAQQLLQSSDKKSADFGDFETATPSQPVSQSQTYQVTQSTSPPQLSQSANQQQQQPSTAKKSLDFGDFESAPATNNQHTLDLHSFSATPYQSQQQTSQQDHQLKQSQQQSDKKSLDFGDFETAEVDFSTKDGNSNNIQTTNAITPLQPKLTTTLDKALATLTLPDSIINHKDDTAEEFGEFNDSQQTQQQSVTNQQSSSIGQLTQVAAVTATPNVTLPVSSSSLGVSNPNVSKYQAFYEVEKQIELEKEQQKQQLHKEYHYHEDSQAKTNNNNNKNTKPIQETKKQNQQPQSQQLTDDFEFGDFTGQASVTTTITAQAQQIQQQPPIVNQHEDLFDDFSNADSTTTTTPQPALHQQQQQQQQKPQQSKQTSSSHIDLGFDFLNDMSVHSAASSKITSQHNIPEASHTDLAQHTTNIYSATQQTTKTQVKQLNLFDDDHDLGHDTQKNQGEEQEEEFTDFQESAKDHTQQQQIQLTNPYNNINQQQDKAKRASILSQSSQANAGRTPVVQEQQIVQQAINAYDLDWDAVLKQTQQTEINLDNQMIKATLEDNINDTHQDFQPQLHIHSKKKAHNNNNNSNSMNNKHTDDLKLFEIQSGEHSSVNNGGNSSVQDQDQRTESNYEKDSKYKIDKNKTNNAVLLSGQANTKHKNKTDFEDELQMEGGGNDLDYDDGFGQFEDHSHNHHHHQQHQQHHVDIRTQQVEVTEANNTIQLTSNVPQQHQLLFTENDEDLFGDFHEITKEGQKDDKNQNPISSAVAQPTVQNNISNSNAKVETQPAAPRQVTDEDNDFDDFEEAPVAAPATQSKETKSLETAAVTAATTTTANNVNLMDLAEFEKHTFDITALEYGAEAKKAAEEQRIQQEKKKAQQIEAEKLEELKKQEEKKRNINPILPFKAGKEIYHGKYWRKQFETDSYVTDSKFYDDLFLELDALGLYIQLEKLLQIREKAIEGNNKNNKKAQGTADDYELTEMEWKTDLTAIVYQVASCDGKCLNNIIYDRLKELTHASIFTRVCQTMHDSNKDVDELVDYLMTCQEVDTHLDIFTSKLVKVQQACLDELSLFEDKMKVFWALEESSRKQVAKDQSFLQYMQGCVQLYYHGNRYSSLANQLEGKALSFKIALTNLKHHIDKLNKVYDLRIPPIQTRNSLSDVLSEQQRREVVEDIINYEQNLRVSHDVCALCLGIANTQNVMYRGLHYHTQCINIWFNKISTIID